MYFYLWAVGTIGAKSIRVWSFADFMWKITWFMTRLGLLAALMREFHAD
jgi:hypothetical protein